MKLQSQMTERELLDMSIQVVNNMGGLPATPKIQCPYCDTKLTSYNLLKDHTISAHNQGIPSTKAVFDKVFSPGESDKPYLVGKKIGGLEIPRFLEKEGKISENIDYGIIIGADYCHIEGGEFKATVHAVIEGVVEFDVNRTAREADIELFSKYYKLSSKNTPSEVKPEIQVGDIWKGSGGAHAKVTAVKDLDVSYEDTDRPRGIYTRTCKNFLGVFTFVRHADTQENVPVFDYDIPVGQYIAMNKTAYWGGHKFKPKMKEYGNWESEHGYASLENKTQPWPNPQESLFLSTENGLVKV